MAGSMSFAPPTALGYFTALVAQDDSLSLLEAAASLAQDAYPRFDPQAVPSQLDAMGAALLGRVPQDAVPMQRLRLLNHFFYRVLGFQANVNDYHDPRNSYLCDVLSRRRGIPVTLGLLYLELAAQIGLDGDGVSFPGHFLVRLKLPQGEVVIDPFNGRSLSRSDLEERLQPWREVHGAGDVDDAGLARWLQPATPRQVVARMLSNLARIHQARGDDLALLAVRERLVTLLPGDTRQRRDRGLVRARVGDFEQAREDLQVYLAGHPDAPDAAAVAQQLRAWRDPGPGPRRGPRCAS